MLGPNSSGRLLAGLVFLLSLVQSSQAIFYIIEKHFESQYSCGTHGELCCTVQHPTFFIYSNPTLPPVNQKCTNPVGKLEAENKGSGKLANCQYGQYGGLGNKWAFCETSYGGNLYLNGLHKRCGKITRSAYTCLGFPTCVNYATIRIACTDDTWYKW